MHAFNPRHSERQSQVDLCDFKAILIYRVSSRTAGATQRNPVSQMQNKQKRTRIHYSVIIKKLFLPSKKATLQGEREEWKKVFQASGTREQLGLLVTEKKKPHETKII